MRIHSWVGVATLVVLAGCGGKIVLPGPPTVTDVTPEFGSREGGTQITITGTNFQEETTVTIADEPVIDLEVVSATTLPYSSATDRCVVSSGS